MKNSSNTYIVKILIEDQQSQIEVSQTMINDGKVIFEQMDNNMDQGWTISREFIDNPSHLQRCQIAANRLLTGLHTENESSVVLMAAYILDKLPNVDTVMLNSEGEDGQTLFYDTSGKLIQ